MRAVGDALGCRHHVTDRSGEARFIVHLSYIYRTSIVHLSYIYRTSIGQSALLRWCHSQEISDARHSRDSLSLLYGIEPGLSLHTARQEWAFCTVDFALPLVTTLNVFLHRENALWIAMPGALFRVTLQLQCRANGTIMCVK